MAFETSKSKPQRVDVCIIGAGASGAAAAKVRSAAVWAGEFHDALASWASVARWRSAGRRWTARWRGGSAAGA